MSNTLVLNKNLELEAERRRRRNMQTRSIIMCFVLILLICAMFGFMSNYIPSESMEPTLSPGDHILTMRSWLAYPFGMLPNRGDIIVFKISDDKLAGPDERTANAATRSGAKTQDEILIKRVVGLPGDRVQLKGNKLYLNGAPQKEDYQITPAVDPDDAEYPYAYYEELKVPPGQVFVLGDNRNNSDDGRFWGTLPVGNILGKMVRVLYNEGDNGPNGKRAQQATGA